MKLPIVIIGFLLMASCSRIVTAYKIEMKNKLMPVNNTNMYFIDSAKSLLSIKMNGHLDTFLLDLGASVNVVNKRPIPVNIKYSMKNSAKGIDGTRYVTELISIDSLTSPIFKWLGAPVLYNNSRSYKSCGREIGNQLLGAGILKSSQPLYINYRDGYMSYVDSSFDKTGYSQLNAQFSAKGIFKIGLIVNGKDIQFLFDPGNTDANYIREDEIAMLQLKEGIPYEKYSLDFKNNLVRSEGQAFKDVPLIVGNLSPVPERFVSTNSIQVNNFGLKSIQKYNWLIDGASKKVYAQPITVDKQTESRPRVMAPQLPMIAPDGRLIVGGILVGKSKFKLGDRIVSVQNRPVTTESTCAMLEILGKTPNWDTLQIVAQPAVP